MTDTLDQFRCNQQQCTRLYASGNTIVDYRTDVETWLEYNRLYRPGCALFVNGELRTPGINLTRERALELYQQKSKPTK